MSQPQVQRRYEVKAPNLYVVDFHHDDCDCPVCESMRDRSATDDPAALLAFCVAGWMAWAGLAIATAIAFAIDPHGAWLALTTAFTGGR